MNNTDPNGEFAVLLANPAVRGAIGFAGGGAAGAIGNAVVQAGTKGIGNVNFNEVEIAGATGAITGAVVAADPTKAPQAGAIAGAASSIATDAVNGELGPESVLKAGVAAAVGSVATTGGVLAGKNSGELGKAALGALAEGGAQTATPAASGAAVSGARAAGNAAMQGVEQLQNLGDQFVPDIEDELN